MRLTKRNRRSLIVIFLLVATVLIGLLILLYNGLNNDTSKPSRHAPNGFKVYESTLEEYDFSFLYPDNLFLDTSVYIRVSNYEPEEGEIKVRKGGFVITVQAAGISTQNIDDWIPSYFKEENPAKAHPNTYTLQKIEPFGGTLIPARKVTSVYDRYLQTKEEIYLLTDKGLGLIVKFVVREEDAAKFMPIHEGIVKSIR